MDLRDRVVSVLMTSAGATLPERADALLRLVEAVQAEERRECEEACRALASAYEADGRWSRESAATACADRIYARGQ